MGGGLQNKVTPNRSKTLLIVLGIFDLVIVTTAASFAFFTYSRVGSTTATIISGDIEFSYIEGESATLTNAFPVKDSVGAIDEAGEYEFQVKMKSSSENVKVDYNVYLVDNNGGSDKYFTNEQIKFALLKNEVYVANTSATSGLKLSTLDGFNDGVSTGEGLVLEEQEITSGKTDNYKLRIWISDDVSYNNEYQSDGMMSGKYNGYTYSLKVKVTSYVIDNNVVSGYLLDNDNNILSNKSLVMYSEIPKYITTNEEGYFYLEKVEGGDHEMYYMGDKNISDLKKMSKEEIIANALDKTSFNNQSESINFSNNIKIDDFIIGNKNDLNIITLKGLEKDIKKVAVSNKVSFNLSTIKDYTNIYSSNEMDINYDNNILNINNVSKISEVYVSNSLSNTLDNLKNNNYILMINNDEIKGKKVINENRNLKMDLNGKNITYNDGYISVLGYLNVIDKNKTGKISQDINYVFTLDKNGKIVIDGVNIETLATDKTVNDATSIYLSTTCTDCKVTVNDANLKNNTDSYKLFNINSENATIEINDGEYFGDILNTGGTVNINNGHFSNKKNSLIINYDGIVNVKGGVFIAGTGIVLNNYGTLNIDDSKGKVYLSTNGNNQIIRTDKKNIDASLNIKGSKAYKNTDNNKVYNLESCTNNPDDLDGGICLYNANHGLISSNYSDVNIDGATLIGRYIAYYQVRTGNGNIKNSYIYTFGDECALGDAAWCSSVRNHYVDSVITIENTDIYNEYYYAIELYNKNNTTNIINSNIESKKMSAVYAAPDSNSNINIKDSNFYVDSDQILMRLVGLGTTIIDGGTYTRNLDAGGSNMLISTERGKLIIKNGDFTINNVNVGAAVNANVYISGGNFKSTTSAWYRGSVKLNQNNGNVYISGGTFDNPNGGSVVSFQGTSDSGNAYICNANIISGRDYYNIENLAGTLYYSANVKFSNGTNTPTGTGDFLSSNYTGSCNP